MLIVLSLLRKKRSPINIFRRDRIRTEILSNGKIEVLNIRYEAFHKNISITRLSRLCDGLSDTVLCPGYIIPDKAPVMRFCDNSLQLILMENFLLSVLSSLPQSEIKICLCDPFARFYELAERLLDTIPEITVATRMPHFYSCRAAAAKGSMNITDDPSSLPECDIIIHPEPVSSTLPGCRFIFSAYEPLINDKRIIYRYLSDIPEEYRGLIPPGTDPQYFLCALYSLERQKKLAQAVPPAALGMDGAMTKEYITGISEALLSTSKGKPQA